MSSAAEENNPQEGTAPSMDEEAYQPVTYAEAFPPLPGVGNSSPEAGASPASSWNQNKKMAVRSTTVTQVFCVPMEERKHKELEQEFGEKSGRQAKICSDIQQRTGVSIEVSLAKDQSLTVVLTGKGDAVAQARRLVVQQLQTQARTTVMIPKVHHRFLLGKSGSRLRDLELSTATKISIPRPDENSDTVTITGTKDGLDKARHEIQLISDEQAKLAFERLEILKEYHPFICGPDNQFIKDLMDKTGARISVPPPSVMKNEIAVAGEKEGVHQAVHEIQTIYNQKKLKCQTVSVEVRKSQHKYVIGPRRSGLSEILASTGVSVEVPSQDSGSETITLRGEQEKLGPALTMVYAKANSVVIREVKAPAWLHRYIIGRSGSNVSKITQELSKVHIEFTDGEDKIVVEGPPEEVEKAEEELNKLTTDLLSRMAFAEIDVAQKYHKHIIGKSGANVMRIKKETGVAIRIPPDSTNESIIRIEGSPEGVAKAKQELMEMVQKMENEKSKDVLIEQRFHKTIIGQHGNKIREIRDKYPEVQINFPDPGRKSEVVTLRGPKNDVDRCAKYLQQYHQELIQKNYCAEVHIFKQFHKNIIGKGGSNISKIRTETDTRIDLPSENSDSDVIAITGKKENVEKAKVMIEAIQKDLANIKEVTIEIPHKHHNFIIGAKGRLIRAIMNDCGGVIIRFPAEGTTSDKVIIRGPKDDVENAKKQLLELAAEKKESSHTAEMRAKPEYHKFLIGRGGANIRKVRDNTGARVVFPSNDDSDQHLITIIGKKEGVDAAKIELETLVKELENIVEGEINVDPKYHRHFVARQGEVLRHIFDEYGGVQVSFPRSGVKSSKVVLKGGRECVENAKARILEIVADLEAQVTIDCVIAQKYHRTVMGAKGYRVQEITKDHNVGIKFPDRPTENGNQQQHFDGAVNGDVSDSSGDGDKPRLCDIIIITGKVEDCEAAKQSLQALVPVTVDMDVPFDFHRFVIGQKGRDVRKMMEENDVNISIPPADQRSNVVRITGTPANVKSAQKAMEERVRQLEGEQEDRELRSFALEVEVDTKYHPKIIGRQGAVITKIRQDHNVQIQFPERGSSVIKITGYETDTRAAKDDILRIVTDLEEQITDDCRLDARIHSRLIGFKGRSIRKIMDEYSVDIRFPRREGGVDPNIVQITGLEDNVYDCKDHLLNLEEEYMQDITEQEEVKQYLKPSRENEPRGIKKDTKGFVVVDAPWSQQHNKNAPDNSSMSDFPDLPSRGPASSGRAPMAWGPTAKR